MKLMVISCEKIERYMADGCIGTSIASRLQYYTAVQGIIVPIQSAIVAAKPNEEHLLTSMSAHLRQLVYLHIVPRLLFDSLSHREESVSAALKFVSLLPDLDIYV